MRNWSLRIVIFCIFLLIGRWIAFSSRELAFAKESKFQLTVQTSYSDQNRLLLIIVDRLDKNPKLEEVWWIGSRSDMPITMVSLYPYFTQENGRDELLYKSFKLKGIWSNRQPQPEFFNTLTAWGINWDKFIIIDQMVQTTIVDKLNGLMIDGILQDGKLILKQLMSYTNLQSKLTFQSKLWAAICSRANQQNSELELRELPFNLSGHILSSPELKNSEQLNILPAHSFFPVCLINTGLLETGLPPIQP